MGRYRVRSAYPPGPGSILEAVEKLEELVRKKVTT